MAIASGPTGADLRGPLTIASWTWRCAGVIVASVTSGMRGMAGSSCCQGRYPASKREPPGAADTNALTFRPPLHSFTAMSDTLRNNPAQFHEGLAFRGSRQGSAPPRSFGAT